MRKRRVWVAAIGMALVWEVSAANPGTDLDLLQAPVIFRGSSFKATHWRIETLTTNYYTAINDGNLATWWEPMESRGPHFIEMLWNQPVKVSGAQWNFENIAHATLRRWRKGAWEPVAVLDGSQGAVDFPFVASDRWRLDIDRFQDVPKVLEMRLSGPEQYLLPTETPWGPVKGLVTVSDVRLPQGVFRPGDEVEVSFRVAASSNAPPFGLMVELSDRAALKSYDLLRNEGSDFCSGRWAAKPDADGRVAIKMELPPWTPNGSNDLLVTALADTSGRFVQVSDQLLGAIAVARPNFPPMMEPVRQVSVGTNAAGQRGFVINGKWHPAFFNRYYGHPTPERLAATAETGLKILYWQNRDGIPTEEADLQARLEWFDQRIRMALRVNPQNYFILSQVMKAPRRWLAKHPNELMLLEDGQPNPEKLVSFGSEQYLRESEDFVSRLIAFISRQPYGDRVIGYHVWTCTQNDGFIGGTMANRKMSRRDDFLLGDYHPGAVKQFRAFLRRKYRNDVSALRKAWRNETVDFDDALVARRDLVREDFPGGTVRDPVRSRPAIDYLEFFPSLIGRYNRRIAAAIKRESGGRALVLLHSGAVKSYLCYAWAQQLQANNNDLLEQLNDPNIDVFVQAQPYDTREAGNAMHVYQPVKSIDLHGKLYLFDHDHRTLGAGVLKYGRHRSQYEGAAVFPRDYGNQWIENSGAWISDMSLSRWYSFNEYRLPWYTMPEVVRPIRTTLDALNALSTPRRPAAEIAVVLSLNSPRYEDACRMVPHYKGLVNDVLLQHVLPFLGAPYDVILSDDLSHPNLPEYKLYLFLNPTYLAPAERQAIERLKRGGKVLAWFYAPGYVTDDGLSVDAMKSVAGIDLKIKTTGAEAPELTFQAESPLATGRVGQKLETVVWRGLGTLSTTTFSPVFHADDASVVPAGRYADGKVAYGHRDFGDWKSVWCGVPNFDLPALVRLARFAGVHLYAEAPVILNADNRMMMVHNGYEGRRTVRIALPRPAQVYDLPTGAFVADGQDFDLVLGSPETKLLRLEYRNGVPNKEKGRKEDRSEK